MIDQKMHVVLSDARKTYGHRNQIGVAIGELCELAALLSKYSRYDNDENAVKDMRLDVTDEFGDTMIVLEHVRAIFGLDEKQITARQEYKIARLSNWLAQSNSLELSVKQRDIPYPVDTSPTKIAGQYPHDQFSDDAMEILMDTIGYQEGCTDEF